MGKIINQFTAWCVLGATLATTALFFICPMNMPRLDTTTPAGTYWCQGGGMPLTSGQGGCAAYHLGILDVIKNNFSDFKWGMFLILGLALLAVANLARDPAAQPKNVAARQRFKKYIFSIRCRHEKSFRDWLTLIGNHTIAFSV